MFLHDKVRPYGVLLFMMMAAWRHS